MLRWAFIERRIATTRVEENPSDASMNSRALPVNRASFWLPPVASAMREQQVPKEVNQWEGLSSQPLVSDDLSTPLLKKGSPCS